MNASPSDDLRACIARLTAADRRALRVWISKAYGVDGNPAPNIGRPARTPQGTLPTSSNAWGGGHARRPSTHEADA